MADTTLRTITMLTLIPRLPRKVTVSLLDEQLQERGFHVKRRTIERDLRALAEKQNCRW